MKAELQMHSSFSSEKIISLSACIQSWGVRVDHLFNSRKGGAGPAEGITLLLNGRPVNAPTSSDFVVRSPYSLHSENSAFHLLENGSFVCQVELPSPPHFYSLRTHDGTPYSKIALLHGIDCLASTVFQTCVHWNSPQRCTFCGIELSLLTGTTIPIKTPQQLAEVAKAACDLDDIQHITLTTGTQASSSDELHYLARCCAAIKNEIDLPIHVQCMPPEEVTLLELLKKSGTDTVGMHIESFDSNLLHKVAPGKAALGLKTYLNAWREAVSIFGRNQVSSFLIAGLGEERASLIEGASLLCELGVYPFIVPLRPIPGTPLAQSTPPDPPTIISIYQEVSQLLKRHNLSWTKSKAGCVRCSACSALPDFETCTLSKM